MKNRNSIYLFLILAAGFFLRIYKIASNYYFTGELGKELLYIRQFAVSHSVPLIGMTTSHDWLAYGPLYYWLMIPIFNLFSGSPYILFWTGLVVSMLGLMVNYFVFKKIAGERIAIFSTMIQAFSPILIWQTRLSKLHVFFFLIMPIFTYLLYLVWNGKKKWIFWAGLTFGLLFSFHFSQIPLLGVVVLLFWIKKASYKFRDWLLFGLGVLLPNLTLIWQDRNLALWLPYRVVNLLDTSPAGTWQSLLDYFGRTMFWDSRLWLIGLSAFAALFVHYISQNKRKLSKDFLPFYLISSISLMLIATVVHGAPPVHYFLPIFTTVPVLLALYLQNFKFWPLIFVPVVVVNLISFINSPVFYKAFTSLIPGTEMVPISTQKAAASFVVMHAEGKPLSIKRVGVYDYFPETYSQNYKYLVLWKGGNLLDTSKNSYTITEDSEKGAVSVQK